MKKTAKIKGRNIIGARVRAARLRATPPLSQEDLSGRLAALDVLLDRSAISRIESGERYVLDYEVSALAKGLRTTAANLFGEEAGTPVSAEAATSWQHEAKGTG